MPTYDYACQACGHEFEEFQSITAKPLRKCPGCKKLKLKRLIGTGAAVIFKGSGFYETDYRSEGYKEAAKAESEAASGQSEAKSEGKTDAKSEKSDKSSDTKPDTTSSKTESKPAEAKPASKPKSTGGKKPKSSTSTP